MKFRTEYMALPAPFELDTDRPVTLLGSCFAQNIALRMARCGWEAANPFGVLYNPLSIAEAIEAALDGEEGERRVGESIFQGAGGFFHSHLFDSRMSGRTAGEVMEKYRVAAGQFIDSMRQGRTLVTTFGTSICYFLKDKEGYVVGNCHKEPEARYERRRVGIEEIADRWERLAARLRERFGEITMVFTVSPVRHLRDGMEGNKRQKAVLLLAVEEICRRVSDATYFPAYEIVNDDLRDYRFYASDLTHPSEQAVEYIWEKFCGTYLGEEGRERLRKREKECRRQGHRPILGNA